MKTRPVISALLLLFTFSFSFQATAASMDEVTVEEGKLRGTMENNIAIFKGVPFARPPVGEFRWKAPQPAQPWDGVKTAQAYAPAPMQAGEPPSGKSEDCLYLNIWTPAASPDDDVPVLVWIYGGGFSFGASSDPIFDGRALANKGVIVVSIAYRVGQLGFLAHPELSAESPNGVSGNYGILDQIAALKWIKKNISQFGGDPDNITIAGESAGGISVSMLSASPLAKGLFEKAISQSGGSFGPPREVNYPGENMSLLQQAESEGKEYVKKFGTTSIDALRKMDAETFIPQGWSLPGGWPIIDGYVIPDDQYKLYQQGKFNDTPVLVGYNSDEGLSFVRAQDPQQFIDGMNQRFGVFSSKLIDAYSISREAVTRNARNLIRDAAFGWHTWSWAKLQTAHGDGDAYLYYFDQHPDHAKGSEHYNEGAAHGQEIAYVFKHLDTSNPDSGKQELQLSESMATYWTNFVKSGNPNGSGLPQWPVFEPGAPTVMHFNTTPKTGPVADENALKVLDDYFEWRRTGDDQKLQD